MRQPLPASSSPIFVPSITSAHPEGLDATQTSVTSNRIAIAFVDSDPARTLSSMGTWEPRTNRVPVICRC